MSEPFVEGTDRVPTLLTAGVLLLVHTNVFISLAATSVAITTILLLGLPLDPVPLVIVFAVALFAYSVNRLADRDEDEVNLPTRAAFVSTYGVPLLAVATLAYVGAIALAVALGLPGTLFLLVPALATVLYSLGGMKRLLLVKNLTVGVVWGGIPLGVGVYYGVVSTPELHVLTGFTVVTLTVAAAVFDIKDIDGDRAEGIRTLPVAVGPRTTRIIAGAVTVATVPAVVVAAAVFSSRFLVLLGLLGYVLAYIPFATPDRGPLFYGFVVDGEHLFLAALTVLVVGV